MGFDDSPRVAGLDSDRQASEKAAADALLAGLGVDAARQRPDQLQGAGAKGAERLHGEGPKVKTLRHVGVLCGLERLGCDGGGPGGDGGGGQVAGGAGVDG